MTGLSGPVQYLSLMNDKSVPGPTPTTVNVAVLQLAAAAGDVDGNVRRIVTAVHQHGVAADMVVAPELATVGYDLDLLQQRGADLAEPVDGPSLGRLADACADVGTTLVTGFLERDGDVLYDSVATIGPDRVRNVYRKTHLYPPELACFDAGDGLYPVPSAAGVLGPMICFEHAFPDVATALTLAGAQILVIPSAVPHGYEYLLTLRTRARAQDNQVFAVAANMTGNGFCGGSLVADPRGEVLVSAAADETVLRARLDLDAITRERKQEPSLRMRRPELYHPAGAGDGR